MAVEHVNARRLRHVAAGVCRDCGKHPPTKNTLTCDHCKESRRAYQERRAAKQKAAVICRRCSGPSRPGKLLCQACNDANVDGMRERRAETRLLIQARFGGKCADCAEADHRCLVLHHINGDGGKECKGKSRPRIATPQWYAKLRLHIEAGGTRSDLLLLCHNCHAKRHFGFNDADYTPTTG